MTLARLRVVGCMLPSLPPHGGMHAPVSPTTGVQTPQEPGRTPATMRHVASRGAVYVSASVGTPSTVRARTELPWSTAAARIGRWSGALAAICRRRQCTGALLFPCASPTWVAPPAFDSSGNPPCCRHPPAHAASEPRGGSVTAAGATACTTAGTRAGPARGQQRCGASRTVRSTGAVPAPSVLLCKVGFRDHQGP